MGISQVPGPGILNDSHPPGRERWELFRAVGGCGGFGGRARLVFKKYRVSRGFLFDRGGGIGEALSFEGLAQR